MELKTGGMSVCPLVVPDSTHLDMYEQVSLAWTAQRFGGLNPSLPEGILEKDAP